MADDVWANYSAALASLSDLVDNERTPTDEVTIAEGYRHLARILYMGLLATTEYSDTSAPIVYLAKTPTQLTGGVTSDAIYYEGFIDGSRPYVLSGRRGTAPLLEITAVAGKIGVTEAGTMVDSIREDTLIVAADGTYEIRLDPEPKPADFDGNWMHVSKPDVGTATYLLIRQYSTDANSVTHATFDIEPLDGRSAPPPLTVDRIRRGLADSVAFTRTLVERWTAITDAMLAGSLNEFLIVQTQGTGGLAMPTGHRFANAGFRLAADEVWVLTIPGVGNPPYSSAPYWGFQLCNYWFEPLDYGDSWAHLNKDTAVYADDGSVTIHVSEQDPGTPNWVQLRGHPVGNAQFRLSRIADPLPEIAASVEKLADYS